MDKDGKLVRLGPVLRTDKEEWFVIVRNTYGKEKSADAKTCMVWLTNFYPSHPAIEFILDEPKIKVSIFHKGAMKRLFWIIATAMCLWTIGCTQPQTNTSSLTDISLKGNHLLHQIGILSSEENNTGNSYFYFVRDRFGAIYIAFSWLGNDGSYHFMQLPINKVRMVTDKRIINPIVSFQWANYFGAYNDDLLPLNIIYAQITFNPKDWPESVNTEILK